MSRHPTGVLADIGGTHARFALNGDEGRCSQPVQIGTSEHADFETALREFLEREGVAPPLRQAAVCGAGPVSGGEIQLTNCAWRLSRAAITAATGVSEPVLVNDFTAVAWALPELGDGDRRLLGGAPPAPNAALAVLGPGTGLGVSGLIPAGDGRFAAVTGEGGHVSLTAANARESAVLERIIEIHGHASAERVVSGPGLVTLYSTLAALDGEHIGAAPQPAEIARAAHEGTSARAAESVALFTTWLGAMAGDLALTLGARGGVYIAGGIVPAWGEHFDAQRFRSRFEAKGRFEEYLAAIPAWAITRPHPAITGLAHMLRQQ